MLISRIRQHEYRARFCLYDQNKICNLTCVNFLQPLMELDKENTKNVIVEFVQKSASKKIEIFR